MPKLSIQYLLKEILDNPDVWLEGTSKDIVEYLSQQGVRTTSATVNKSLKALIGPSPDDLKSEMPYGCYQCADGTFLFYEYEPSQAGGKNEDFDNTVKTACGKGKYYWRRIGF